jgi:hypothetical protein
MTDHTQSSLRTNTGKDQPISGTVVNVDDPQRLGRVQICPDTLDPSKVKEENCPWCHIDSMEAQSWNGSTPHTKSGLRRGHKVNVQFGPDGTGRISSTYTTMTGGDAPAGSATLPQGEYTYPSSSSDQ